jgi:predicted deacylase
MEQKEIDNNFLEIARDFLEFGKKLGMQTFTLSNGAPILFKDGQKILSILSGLHGDEKAGPLFLHSLLQKFVDQKKQMFDGILIIPILNEDGWTKNNRNWNGVDLNRQFDSDSKPQIIKELIEIYTNKNIQIHWDIHEDDTSKTEYVFGYEPNITMPEALSMHLECALINWNMQDEGEGGKDEGSSESFMARRGVDATTTESPPTWELSRRIEWNEKIFEWLMNRYGFFFDL